MDDELSVTELVRLAVAGERAAWDRLVVRYTPLVMSIAFRYRLSADDAADVAQTVWLRLVQSLRGLREPAALPGWITTTARHECLNVLRTRQRVEAFDPQLEPTRVRVELFETPPEIDAQLLQTERHEVLLAGFAELSERDRNLLLMLVADPPWSYAEIGKFLEMPVGSIGPTRARALDRLRRSDALTAFLGIDDR